MDTKTADKFCLRLAGIVLSGVFSLILGVAILSAAFPQWNLHPVFSPICHQQLDRSHFLNEAPLGVCIRCFWLYFGLFLGHARFTIFQYIPRWSMYFLILSAILGGLDWVSGWWVSSGNPVEFRIISSTLIGIAISHFTTPAVASLIKDRIHSTIEVGINHEYK